MFIYPFNLASQSAIHMRLVVVDICVSKREQRSQA